MVIGSSSSLQIHVVDDRSAGHRVLRSLQQLAPAQAETRPPTPIDLADRRVRRRPILGGLTSEYEIVA